MTQSSYQEKKIKWPKTLVEVLEHMQSAFIRNGDNEEQAKRHAEIGVEALSFYLGGRITYIPMGKALKTAMKHKRIYEAHQKGKPVEDIAIDADINIVTVYKIIDEQRKLHRTPIKPNEKLKQETDK